MAADMPGESGVISGMRGSCEVVISININQAVLGGKLPFFISNNGVILCPGAKDGRIPPQFFRSVYDLKSMKYLQQ
jgi:2'-phosphotransferase